MDLSFPQNELNLFGKHFQKPIVSTPEKDRKLKRKKLTKIENELNCLNLNENDLKLINEYPSWESQLTGHFLLYLNLRTKFLS